MRIRSSPGKGLSLAWAVGWVDGHPRVVLAWALSESDGIEIHGAPSSRVRAVRDRVYAALILGQEEWSLGARVWIVPPLDAGPTGNLDAAIASALVELRLRRVSGPRVFEPIPTTLPH